MRGEATLPESEEPAVVALVAVAQRGDLMAMEELLAVLAPYVGRLTGPIALDDGPHTAQVALTAIFRNPGRLRDPAALYGWVRAIAVREALRVARAAARSRPTDLAEVPSRGDPQLAVDTVYDQAVITAEFARELYVPLTFRYNRIADHVLSRNLQWSRTEPLMATLRMPVQVIWGQEDRLMYERNFVPRWRQLVPHAQITVLDHAGHAVEWDQPAEVHSLVEAFLA